MAGSDKGIPQETLDWLDEAYLKRTLEEIPSSPMMPQSALDAIPHARYDIPYDDKSARQKIDLYLPPEASPEAPVPLVVFFHGGGFMAGDRRDMQVAIYLGVLNHGYALASVGYRVSSEAQFPEPVRDCKAAIRRLRAIAPAYGIDPSRIAVAGNSAGAYMALMVACTPNVPLLENRSTGDSAFGTEVRCCIATYPPVDFSLVNGQKLQEGDASAPMSDPASPESRFMGAAVTSLPPEVVQAASPAHYLTPTMPPILLKAGTYDKLVPHAQSVYFANRAKLVAGDDRVDFELVPGAGHHDPAFKRPSFLAEALTFLDKHMK